MKITTATIADVEKALTAYKVVANADPKREGLDAKKLAAAVVALTPKDDVTKLLNQAYGYGESNWAKNVLNGELEGCTKDNKLEKIKLHVQKSDAYNRLYNEPASKDKVEMWLAEKFPAQTIAE